MRVNISFGKACRTIIVRAASYELRNEYVEVRQIGQNRVSMSTSRKSTGSNVDESQELRVDEASL